MLEGWRGWGGGGGLGQLENHNSSWSAAAGSHLQPVDDQQGYLQAD
jgi:hypothetical protein